MGNTFQSFSTLAYTNRIYNGLFVPNPRLPSTSMQSLTPASSKDAEKAKGQVTPLAGRLFGVYTFMAGLIRFYAAYEIENPRLYQLAIWTHIIAAAHFTSEALIYGGINSSTIFGGPPAFPFLAAYGGLFWMLSQYSNYVAA